MGDFDVKIEGVEEFQEKLKTVEEKAPDGIIDELNHEGKKLKTAAKNNTPKISNDLRKGYKLLPIEKIKGGYQIGMTNTCGYFHLVERGHRRVSRSGKEFKKPVKGKFYLKKTVEEQEEPITEGLKEWLNTLFQELK